MRLIILLLGLVAGILSGMAAGGGTVLVPGLVLLLGLSQHKAQGAVLAAFLATQTAAVYGQWRQGKIRLDLAWWMIGGAAAGAVAGALMAARTRPGLLREIYGWYLILLGAANWIDFRQRERA
jgi:uncharacterized membrane protein YfcA